MLDQCRQHSIALVASPTERQRLVVVEHVLQIRWRIFVRRSEVESAEARVTLMHEHQWLLQCECFADLELALNKEGNGGVRLRISTDT